MSTLQTWIGLVAVAAIVGAGQAGCAVSVEEEGTSDQQGEPASVGEAQQPLDAVTSNESASQSEGDDDSILTCQLELVEPCIASVAVCAVRCCDGSLFKSVQQCGNCLNWSWGACYHHGTRRRVRWEPLY